MQGRLLDNPERQRGGVEFLLHRAAEIYPHRLAIDDRLNQVTLTYGELRSRSIRLAKALEELGVGKGDVVATAFRNEAAAIEALFACALIGAVNAPLNTRLAPIEASKFIEQQGAVAFLGHYDFRSYAGSTRLKVCVVLAGAAGKDMPEGARHYESVITQKSDRPFPPRASWTDPYMIGMTGGTTGGSKGAVWSHGGCLMDMLSIISHWSIKPGYKALCVAPAHHAAGLGWACMPVLWQAGTVVFPSTHSFDPKWFLETIAEDRIDCFFLVPAMVQPLYERWDQRPFEHVKSIALAAAPVPKALRLKISEMFPKADKLVCYGMTECFSITMQKPDDFVEFGDGVGEPALVARLEIVDDDGVGVPRGLAGHVIARTAGQCLYYNNDTENTAKTFHVRPDDPEGLEWVSTGDVGYLDENGRLTLLDRAKDIIITGGENVASTEVESVLSFHPGVKECAVIGMHDDRWGELVCAVIVIAGEIDRRSLACELYSSCRQSLGPYKIPKRFVFVDALPRSAVGKILKRELRERTYDLTFEGDQLRATHS